MCDSVLELEKTAVPKDRIYEEKYRVLRKHHVVIYSRVVFLHVLGLFLRWTVLETPRLIVSLKAA